MKETAKQRKARKMRDLETVKQSQRHKRDDAAYFNLVGGPHHGIVVRVYAPWDVLKFENAVYEIHPPLAKGGEWVYIHKGETSA